MKTATDTTTSRSPDFEQLVMDHLDLMNAVALNLTKNPVDAQDLTQEAVVRALRFHDKFQRGTYIKAWLLTILRNTFINEYRKRARQPEIVELTGHEPVRRPRGDPEMGFYPEELSEKYELEMLTDDVRHAVDALPDWHRRTVIMADIRDMSYKEIAETMDCPLGTVMSRLHRGRKLLRKELEKRHVMCC